jgi:hypothetical protein
VIEHREPYPRAALGATSEKATERRDPVERNTQALRARPALWRARDSGAAAEFIALLAVAPLLFDRRRSRVAGESMIRVDRLVLHDPEEAERLLQSYFWILGERQLWWQRCAEAEDPRWKSCVRAAIENIAARSRFDPEVLADWLDDDVVAPLYRTRSRVLRIARERLYE